MKVLGRKMDSFSENFQLNIIPNVLLTPEQVDGFVRANFTDEMQNDRSRLLAGVVTQTELEQIVAKYEHLSGKWQETLTLYDFSGKEIIENIPHALVHVLALPHGASDCLILNITNNKVLINRRLNHNLEGIGGHKITGCTFRENTIKELLEEVFGCDFLEEVSDEDYQQFIKDNVEFVKFLEGNLHYTNNRTVNANFVDKKNQINIHVSDLYILKIDEHADYRGLPVIYNGETVINTNIRFIDCLKPSPKASQGIKWYDFSDANRIAKSRTSGENGFFFGILWQNFLNETGDVSNIASYIANLGHP